MAKDMHRGRLFAGSRRELATAVDDWSGKPFALALGTSVHPRIIIRKGLSAVLILCALIVFF